MTSLRKTDAINVVRCPMEHIDPVNCVSNEPAVRNKNPEWIRGGR
jgi:hypothetical protein